MARILSLEYEPLIGDCICLLLQTAGYEAVTTSNVHEALLILRTQSIDLLTLAFGSRHVPPPESLRHLIPEEFYLPEFPVPAMNGEEFLSLVKADEQLCHIPVILHTGHEKPRCAELLRRFDLDIERDIAGHVLKGQDDSISKLLDTIGAILRPR